MIDDDGGACGSVSSADAEKKQLRAEKSPSSVESFWNSTDEETKL